MKWHPGNSIDKSPERHLMHWLTLFDATAGLHVTDSGAISSS